MKKYLSLVKFAHTIFALPFALVAVFWAKEVMEMQSLAPTKDYWVLILLVIVCMVTARNAAMAFNRYIDRDIDSKNPRTQSREIPAGIISSQKVLVFTAINSLLFVLSTWFINDLCFYLSPVALAVVLGYSLTKRITALCHLFLGLGLALAPVGAFLAITGEFRWEPIVLGFAVLTWVSGFDIIYALQDEEFDKENSLHSIPSLLGIKKSLWISIFLHLCAAVLIGIFGWMIEGKIMFWTGAIIFSLILVYQHFLVKENDLSKIGLAFFTTNGVASLIFATFVIAGWLINY